MNKNGKELYFTAIQERAKICSLIGLYDEAIKDFSLLSKISVYPEHRTISNLGISNILRVRGEYEKALDIEKKTLRSALISDKDQIMISDILNSLAATYGNLGDFKKAVQFSYRSYKILKNLYSKKIKDKDLIFRISENMGSAAYLLAGGYLYLNDISKSINILEGEITRIDIDRHRETAASLITGLGIMYNNIKEFDKALELYQKSLKIRESIGDVLGVCINLNNIGYVLNDKGQVNRSIEFFKKSLVLSESISYLRGIIQALNNMGSYYLDRDSLLKSFAFYNRSLQISIKIGERFQMPMLLEGIGFIQYLTGDFDKALRTFSECEDISHKYNDINTLLRIFIDRISLYISKSNFINALKDSKKIEELFYKTKDPDIEISHKISKLRILADKALKSKSFSKNESNELKEVFEEIIVIPPEKIKGFTFYINAVIDYMMYEKDIPRVLEYLEMFRKYIKKEGSIFTRLCYEKKHAEFLKMTGKDPSEPLKSISRLSKKYGYKIF